MALTFIRSSVARLNGVYLALSKSGGCLVSSSHPSVSPAITQIATLKFTHGEKYNGYQEPFKYWEKNYKWYHIFYDHTSWRFTENSKVIVVDGNAGVGKKEFAKQIAKNFDLKYIPPVTEEDLYVKQDSKLDCRVFNEHLPFTARYYDLTTFALDPDPKKSGRAALLQFRMYRAKWYRYMEGLNHLLNTGQGVVFVNSVYSDHCYYDALRDAGVFRPTFSRAYHHQRDNSICNLLKPHLFIYLDAPVSTIMQNLKDRNDPKEVNNKITYNEKFLKNLEENFQRHLDVQRRTSEVMELDWEKPADDMEMDWISEEIQMLDLEAESNEDVRFRDWVEKIEDDWDTIRYLAGKPWKQNLFFDNNNYMLDCDELWLKDDDMKAVQNLVDWNPMYLRPGGYNEHLGHNPYGKLI